MKKLILSIVVLVAIVAVTILNARENLHGKMLASDFALANIEALANGEDGTAVDWCYLVVFNYDSGWKKFCNPQTNSSTIYPCPQTENYNYYSHLVTDRCTTGI
jgi:hypothetical protein